MSRTLLSPSRSLPVALLLAISAAGVARATVHEVMQDGLTFTPANLEIQVGDTVHWTWQTGIHTVTSGSGCTPDGLFDAPLSSTDPEFSFTFDTAGTVDYFCTPHCALGMTGTVTVSASSDVPESASPLGLRAYPNPFRAGTDVALSLEEAGPVRVEVFDAGGRRAALVHSGWMAAGPQRLHWDGSREDGSGAPSGIYYARITVARTVRTLLLTKVD